MKREVFFLIGANDAVLWSDTAETPLALPDSRARWEAIWSRRAEVVELAHSHPIGPDAFSHEDVTTMEALDAALGRALRFSLVTPSGYFVRGEQNVAVKSDAPAWVEQLRAASGMI
ncbi:MAG: Mov34/MPN/PAD-1 family protein [Archangium sp.]